jgi:hypothetical protein
VNVVAYVSTGLPPMTVARDGSVAIVTKYDAARSTGDHTSFKGVAGYETGVPPIGDWGRGAGRTFVNARGTLQAETWPVAVVARTRHQ